MDGGMPYSRAESEPDLSGITTCAFCRLKCDGCTESRPYCDSYCETSDKVWWQEIHVGGVPKKDPTEGRQWLTLGGDGL